LKISRGSLFELETQLIIAKNQNFIQNIELFDKIMKMITEEGKMLNSFIKKLDIDSKINV
jgi:four helix bundle protein